MPTKSQLKSKHYRVIRYYPPRSSSSEERWRRRDPAPKMLPRPRPLGLCFRGSRGGHVILWLCLPTVRWMVGVKMAAAAAASIRERQTGTIYSLLPAVLRLRWRYPLPLLVALPRSGCVLFRDGPPEAQFQFLEHWEPLPFWVFREDANSLRTRPLICGSGEGASGWVVCYDSGLVSFLRGFRRVSQEDLAAGIFPPLLPPLKSLGLFLCMVQFSASFSVEGVSFLVLPPQLQHLGILSEQLTFCYFSPLDQSFGGTRREMPSDKDFHL